MKGNFTWLLAVCLLLSPMLARAQWYSNDVVHVQNGGLLYVNGTTQFDGTGAVSVAAGGQITVTSNLTTSTSVPVANAGVIDVGGNWTNSGSVGITGTAGTLNLNGASSVFTDNFSTTTALNNLIVNFSAGSGTLTSTDPIQVGGAAGGTGTGVLTLTSGRLVLGNKNLIITNPSAGAITRTNGLIISDEDAEKVVWQLRNNTGSYVVPFGNIAGVPTFITANIGMAGAGAGSVSFNSYATNSVNLPLPGPVSVAPVRTGYTTAKTYDRYWSALPNGYTTNPTMSGLVVNYAAADMASPNTITTDNFNIFQWAQGGSAWAEIGTVPNTVTRIGNSTVAPAFGYYAIAENPVPLPVTLLYLTATSKKTTIQLDWATATEKNNEGFDIERSTDNTTFQKIGFVKGNGTSNRKIVYAFEDFKAQAGQLYYYRLKQTDHDGKFEYSNVVKANLGSWQASLYPNPTEGKIFVRLDSRPGDGSVSYTLLNAIGQVIEKQVQHLSDGQSEFGLDFSHLPSGMYNIHLSDQSGQNSLQKSFVVRR